MAKHLPCSTLSRIKQWRIAEERREHSLNPAGLSRAVELILPSLALRATWASHASSKGLSRVKRPIGPCVRKPCLLVIQGFTTCGLSPLCGSSSLSRASSPTMCCGLICSVADKDTFSQQLLLEDNTAWMSEVMWLSNHSLRGRRCYFNERLFVWMFKGQPQHACSPRASEDEAMRVSGCCGNAAYSFIQVEHVQECTCPTWLSQVFLDWLL